MDAIDALMTILGITLSRSDLRARVMESSCEGMADEGERLVQNRLVAARDGGFFTNQLLGEILQVARQTILGWLGGRPSANTQLAVWQYLQLCVAMDVEPPSLMPTTDELMCEFIRSGMNETNRHSHPSVTPLNLGDYPNYTLNRSHWETVEELTLLLLGEALNREIA